MARATGYVYDERYLRHLTGGAHPERPARLKAIRDRVLATGLIKELVSIPPYEAPLEWIERLHDPDYIRRFKEACDKGQRSFEVPDCGICDESYDIARLAAGGVMAAGDAVMNGQVQNAFCAVRPPGHHAEHNRALGFCFFNNVAIAAIYLIEHYGLERVAVIDWDVHHGNGTQHLFESDPRVFYLSLHEDPQFCYPGTGYRTEQGKGPGQGFTLNLPMPLGAGDAEYLAALDQEALPPLLKFDPQFVLISAGFDAHARDPLAQIQLSREGFAAMGSRVLELARERASGRVITVLEGGYNLTVLAECVEDHLRLLLGQELT